MRRDVKGPRKTPLSGIPGLRVGPVEYRTGYRLGQGGYRCEGTWGGARGFLVGRAPLEGLPGEGQDSPSHRRSSPERRLTFHDREVVVETWWEGFETERVGRGGGASRDWSCREDVGGPDRRWDAEGNRS